MITVARTGTRGGAAWAASRLPLAPASRWFMRVAVAVVVPVWLWDVIDL